MSGRFIVRSCPECKRPFSAARGTKYCSDPCKNEAKKRQNAEYERRVKRPPHLYRKKKLAPDQMQYELPLDNPRTDVYKKAS
jgi:hypothetical protein